MGQFCRIFKYQKKALVDLEVNFDLKRILDLAFSSQYQNQPLTLLIRQKESSSQTEKQEKSSLTL
jgi:hypothetical protein